MEQLGYRKNYFTVHAHTNETQTAQTPSGVHLTL